MTKHSWNGTCRAILVDCEPSLDELFADSVLHAVLRRDRLTVEDLKRHIVLAQRQMTRSAA